MRLDRYRQVLARRGVRPLLLLALVARVPAIAAGITLTLHVVLDQHRGYAAAGLVGAASTIGTALGSPLLGRLVDRRGLRPVLVATTLAEAVFWTVAPRLPYPVLVPVAFAAGLLALPAFTVVRQSLAALVPENRRREVFAIDAMSVEVSYMAAPATAVLLVTTYSATVAMWCVGVATVLSGAGLYLLNPPTVPVGDEEPASAAPADGRKPRVLTLPVVLILLATAGTTFVLSGADVGIVAVLRGSGQLDWGRLVFVAWGGYSLLGGFVYGALRRPWPALTLMALMGLFTIPLGLAGQWQWFCLLLAPAGLLCAPSLAASADEVARLAPASVRGEAMGWYGSATTAGISAGAPVVGFVIDRYGPVWAFAVAGAVGAAIALGAMAVVRTGDRRRPGSVVVDDGAEAEPVVVAQLRVATDHE